MKDNASLGALKRIVGAWVVSGTHPALPGRSLPGKVTFELIEGGAFVKMHSKMEDPEFPEGVAIFGTDGDSGQCTLLYFDTRGVARRYEVELRAEGFSWSRDSPKFSQRFRVQIADDGRTMRGEGEMKRDDGPWEADLCLSYERAEA